MPINRNREGRSPNTGVAFGLIGQIQAVAIFGAHGHTEIARTNSHQEVDNLRRHFLGRADEITFIFSVLIVDQDDDLAIAKIFQNVRYGVQHVAPMLRTNRRRCRHQNSMDRPRPRSRLHA